MIDPNKVSLFQAGDPGGASQKKQTECKKSKMASFEGAGNFI